jgi:hypothetical protein
VGGIAGGIVGGIAGITGISGVEGGCGAVAGCASDTELTDGSAGATIVVGTTGPGTPSSVRAGLAASAATVPHTERLTTNEERRDMIQEDMYPSSLRCIRKMF